VLNVSCFLFANVQKERMQFNAQLGMAWEEKNAHQRVWTRCGRPQFTSCVMALLLKMPHLFDPLEPLRSVGQITKKHQTCYKPVTDYQVSSTCSALCLIWRAAGILKIPGSSESVSCVHYIALLNIMIKRISLI
jgi:hypothetical protein